MKEKVASILCVDLDATILPDSPYTWDFFISHYLSTRKPINITGSEYFMLRNICDKPKWMTWHKYLRKLTLKRGYSKPKITLSRKATQDEVLSLLSHWYDENEVADDLP